MIEGVQFYFRGASKLVQVPLNGLDAVLVLTLTVLKWEFPTIGGPNMDP